MLKNRPCRQRRPALGRASLAGGLEHLRGGLGVQPSEQRLDLARHALAHRVLHLGALVRAEPGDDGVVALPVDAVRRRPALDLGHAAAEAGVLERGAARHQLVGDALQGQPARGALEEEAARVLPRHRAADGALGRHAARAVVHVGKLVRHLRVQRQQQVLALGDLHRVVLRGLAQLLQHRVQAVHERDLVLGPELDLADAGRLQDAAARVVVGVELDAVGVDVAVHHHPRAAANLALGRDVDEHGEVVLAQGVHDHGAKLEHLARHVAGAAGEAAPVGKDHDGKVLRAAKVANGRRRLVRAVGEPHLARLRQDGLAALRVRGVRRHALLHQPRLHGDHAHGDAAQLGAARHHRLAPAGQRLGPAALVEEARLSHSVDGAAGQHPARVVRLLGGGVADVAVHRVRGGQHRRQHLVGGGDVAEPLQDGLHAGLVVGHLLVGDAVGNHDLRTAQLVLAGVHSAPQQLVEGAIAGEDERAVVHLDDALAEAADVGADADGAAGDVAQGEGLLVRGARLARDEAGAHEVLHADAVLGADDVGDHEALLALVEDLLHLHAALRQGAVLIGGEVEVLEAEGGVGGVVPADLELVLQLLHQADARAGVTRDVHAGHALSAGNSRGGGVELVLRDAEGAALEGAVVGDEDDLAAGGVLGRVQLAAPRDHASVVGARGALRLHQHAGRVHHQLLGLKKHVRHDGRRHRGDVLVPLPHQLLLQQAQEVVRKGGADAARGGALDGQARGVGHAVLQGALLAPALRVHAAEALHAARHAVQDFLVALHLEPLSRHAGRDDAHRHSLRALADHKAKLDLVHLLLEQLGRVGGDVARHLAHDGADLVRGLAGNERQEVDVEVHAGDRGGHRVQQRQLSRVHRLGEQALQAAVQGVGAVRNAAQQQVAGAARAAVHIRRGVHVQVPVDGGQALHVLPQGRQLVQLHEMGHGGALAAVDGVLRVVQALEEGVVAGQHLRGVGHQVDELDAHGLHLLAVLSQDHGHLAVRLLILDIVHTDVQHVQRQARHVTLHILRLVDLVA
mmetsp:Transcript_30156/g.77433  ORF Transcript_30156/g.77433 Transcript_30156/m.77433 type:complete len:1026 (-) Transcript_30156:2583-5660(-)